MRLIQNIPKTPNGICIVGEAPGADEEKYGKPFIGWEGQYLRRQLKAAGINFNDCYVTNTVHVRPPRNNYDALTSAQISEGIEQLKKDIERWRPNVVIAVGAKALKALTGHTQITQFRGAVLESTLVPGQKVVATIHPGGILRGGEKMGRYEPIQILDFKKALRESRFPEIVYPERNILPVYSHSRALELLHSVTDKPDPVAVDIETVGSSLVAYGIATSKSEAFVITKDLLRDPTILRAVAQFAFSSTPKIFHNALFDCLHGLGYYKIITNNIHCDTMIAQHAVYPTLPKSLAFCASIYTNEVYWKSEGKTIFDDIKKNHTVDWESLYIYNGKDCCLTYEIYEILMKEIDEWGVRKAYDLMMSLIGPCLFAMLRGTKISMYKLLQFEQENEKAIEVLTRIKDAVVGDVNVQSHKQLKELIYEQWDMPKQFRGKRLTVDDKKLAMLERYPTPYRYHIGIIRMLKKYLKRRDFYNLKINDDGRIRTALKITGTYTGRFASSESIFGSGKNLLNIPKETRKFYVADDGKIMIQGDLSQAEARIVAALCGDEKWLREFDETDVHKKVASGLFGVPFDQVTKYQRNIAKRVAHGTHYGLGKILLSEILGCSPKEAQAHKDRYYELRPKLKEWQERVKHTVRTKRMLRTVFGRVIQFFGPITDKLYRDAIAAEPQSTSADYLNTGLARLYERNLPWWEFLLSVYDSILCQVPDNLDAIEETIHTMKELVEVEIVVNGLPMVIPLSFEIGYSWGELEEIKDDDIRSVYRKLQR